MNLNGVSIEKLPLGEISPDDERKLSAFLLNLFEAHRRFWAPSQEIGQSVVDAIGGDLFTAAARAEMRMQKKAPIEIPEGWPKFQAMVGVAILSMKSGGIIPQRGEDAPNEEMMGIISKIIDNELNLQALREACVRDAYATGCPQFIIFDKPTKNLTGKTMDAFRPSWKAGFLDPLCRDTQGLSDCRSIAFQSLWTKDELLRKFPHRKPQIEDAFKGVSTFGENADTGLTSDQRTTLFTAVETGKTEVETLGRVSVNEIYSMVTQRVTVYSSPKSEKPIVLQAEDGTAWDQERVNSWLQQNPDWKPIEMDVDILWVSSVLMTGQVMENRPHWFQEGRFPIACLVLQWHDDKPVTPLQFAKQNWQLQAIAKTEHIHSIRLSTDGLTLVREGAISNEADLTWELTRPGGMVIVKKGVSFDQALYRVPNGREQVAWRDAFMEAQLANERLTVDRNLEGGAQSSQESSKAIQLRVTQMQNKSVQAQRSVNAFARQITQIKLDMIPKLVTEEQAFRYIDETNGQRSIKEIVVNQTETDFLGDPLRIINNLDGAKYDVVEVDEDDSPTGREADINAFAFIMQNLLPGVAPEFYSDFLGQIPNPIAQKIAKKLKERMEAQANAPKQVDAKLTGTLDLSKVMYDPVAREAAVKAGFLDEQTAASLGAMQPGATAAPAPQPTGATP